MVTVFYNDNAGRLERTVFQALRDVGVQKEKDALSPREAGYTLFSYNATDIRFYRKYNSVGSVTIRIEIEGLQENYVKNILETRLGKYLKKETKKR